MGIVWYPLIVAAVASPLVLYLMLVLGVCFGLSRRVPGTLAVAAGAVSITAAVAALLIPSGILGSNAQVGIRILQGAGLLDGAGFALLAGTLVRTALVWLRHQP